MEEALSYSLKLSPMLQHLFYHLTIVDKYFLEQKEEDFAIAHAQDSDAELLVYLRQCAAELRHSPWPREIVGWKYLTERFEDWNEMLRRAHLPMPTTANKVSSFQLMLEETKYQKQVYRQKKEKKKAKAAERRKFQAEKQAE